MKAIFLIFGIAVGLIVLSFSVVNAHSVHLYYFIGETEVPLALLLAVTIAFGAVLGVLGMTRNVMQLKLEISRLKKSIKLTEKEIANLRAMPIKD